MSGHRKGGHEEEHENHERWLVSYADMMTLLMVLFVVMFAMSTVDQKKFNALKAGMAAGFGQSTSVLDGSSSILSEPGTSVAAPIAPNQTVVDLPPGDQKEVLSAVAKTQRLAADRNQASADAESSSLTKVWKRISATLNKKGLGQDVQAAIDQRGLVISLVSRHVVFEPDMAQLTPRGQQIVAALAPVLAGLPQRLEIDGHTNQVNVKPRYFPTDWELSSARAVQVLRYLNESAGIDNDRMTAAAFGHTRPLVNPATPGSQDVNKRVDIVVLTKLPAETQALLKKISLT
ncbi:MAG: flagellar motor protein MotB [Actinomycetota bacterium]|nr:flagellar motor protein MotB [Actinomycetota bacterium]